MIKVGEIIAYGVEEESELDNFKIPDDNNT